ncbi:MAG: hypothetical protein MUO34_07260 [Ignavibacteriaceae bacterium]|nr:hypothetical protein [Ignavibacteriaceae bacterium]
MPSFSKADLINGLCPPLDKTLVNQLLDEFLSIEKRFIQRDWEPATLDGGQFCEAASRIINHIDSNNLNLRKGVSSCVDYIEDQNNSNIHHYPDRKSSLHTIRVIKSVYKFRSDRGAVHIDPVYTANHIDSRMVLENVRWILSEILRIFWQNDRAKISKIIKEIVQYDFPIIGNYEDKILVHRTDCSAEEELLLLLHFAGIEGYSRKQLGEYIQKDNAQVTRAIKKLSSNKFRQIIKLNNGNYRLTDPGILRVQKELYNKLKL